MVCPPRLQLGTHGLEDHCSMQLSYGHIRYSSFRSAIPFATMAGQGNLSVFPDCQPCDHLGLMDYSYYRFVGSLELRGSLNQTDCPISVRKCGSDFSFLRGPISNCTTQNCRLQPAHHTTTRPSQSAILSPCKSLLGRVPQPHLPLCFNVEGFMTTIL